MAFSVQFHTTRRGILAHFTADQCIGESLRRYGEWAEDEIALLANYVPAGATVLDVGANVGVHTLAFAELVGALGRVVAIEAQPSVFVLLAHNIVSNGLQDVVTALPALSGEGAALVPHTITPISENVGAKSFVADVNGTAVASAGLSIKLPLYSIDSLGLDTCALIKIDVEGMEANVIKGAQDTIRSLHPVVYFEQASADTTGLTDSFRILNDAGYRLFWHNSNPFNRANFKGDTVNIFRGNTEMNVLALPISLQPPVGLTELTDPSRIAPLMSLADGLKGALVPFVDQRKTSAFARTWISRIFSRQA